MKAILGESFPRTPSHSASQIPTTNETTLGKPKSHLTSFLMKAYKQIQESSYFAHVNIGPGERTAPGNTVDSQAHCEAHTSGFCQKTLFQGSLNGFHLG